MAQEMGLSARTLSAVMNVGGEAISLSQPVAQSKEQSLEDFLSQDSALSIEKELIQESIKKRLREALRDLGRNEQDLACDLAWT